MQSPSSRDDAGAASSVVALDIGGTKINAALVRIRGGDAEIVETATTPTMASDGHGGVLATTIQVAEEVLAAHPGTCLDAVGMSAGGVIDSAHGIGSGRSACRSGKERGCGGLSCEQYHGTSDSTEPNRHVGQYI